MGLIFEKKEKFKSNFKFAVVRYYFRGQKLSQLLQFFPFFVKNYVSQEIKQEIRENYFRKISTFPKDLEFCPVFKT